MNNIAKRPLQRVGYDFIDENYLPKGKNEYFLRNQINDSTNYRSLTAAELEILVRNNNTSDNWNNILVSELFDPQLVKNCSFFGLVRIGKLEPISLEFKNLSLSVGLFNSTIISCDLGDNISVHNVNYMAHYIIGNEVIIANVNELATTSSAKFGNGILKQGESESLRIWMEICNENGGRKVMPFDGMLTADAYLWSKYRADEVLMEAFQSFTEKKFDQQRGHYGIIGDRTVIKNCKMIKDVRIGTDAYIKGANKIKNVTVNSTIDASTQIGEGCELVNGIIGVGCRIFYGVKAVRFFMASHSQLKYGARLINSYLGNNATISCCEVLNSLIYPFHEQHHNNSFLCASLLMGQTNMAAGATIGSNHNSRSADGELIAGRGFWPGLCVSLKHNSKFASFTLLAKGDFPFELKIPIPFSLVINDTSQNELRIIPAYWFQYNYYALKRNEWKYKERDARIERELNFEYKSLAPDSVNEMFHALYLLSLFCGKAYYRGNNEKIPDDKTCIKTGKKLLEKNDPIVDGLKIIADTFENSKRDVVILKVRKAYAAFKDMIFYYGMGHVLEKMVSSEEFVSADFLNTVSSSSKREDWVNLGGQLMPESELETLVHKIHIGKIKNWENVHSYYFDAAANYNQQVLLHAVASLMEIEGVRKRSFSVVKIIELLKKYNQLNESIFNKIVQTRQKDMSNTFRKMIYENDNEQEKVLGSLNENSFITELNKERIRVNRNIKFIFDKFPTEN